MSNAVKFTEEGGVTLSVEATPVENLEEEDNSRPSYSLFFAVEDTGPGIAPRDIEYIFDAFSQTDIGKKSQQGTGLGLPISRKYMQLMGGELNVASQVGLGTVFSFNILAQQVEASEIVQQEKPKRVVGLAKNQEQKRILVVEDVSEIRQLLVEFLEVVGFDVKEAKDGMEAIEVWREWSPHLIWMDLRMPVMNGYEATRHIREVEEQQHQKVTVILALTAFAFEEQRQRALEAGCDDYLRKPFQEHEIFEKISKYLEVQYVYEGETEIEDEANQQNGSYVPKALLSQAEVKERIAYIPGSLLKELNQAAVELNTSLAMSVIDQLQQTDAELAHTLKDWVKTFHFDKIADLEG